MKTLIRSNNIRNAGVALAAAFASVFCHYSSARAAGPHELDIASYHETFSETFRGTLDVTPWGPSRWIAHTPWHGDFGDARFSDPTPGFPFETGTDGLYIIARKGADGKWESGLLSSRDAKGNGFAQAGGYFEARMQLPPGPGVWPAFWLSSLGDKDYSSEVDVIEYYGKFPEGYHVNLHRWPKSKENKHQATGELIQVPPHSLTEAFHTYGVDVGDEDMVFYLDRHEVARMPTPPEAKTPMSILVNLALGSGWPIDQTPNPSTLKVDYIKVFQKN